jgi:hypothetical protein
MSEFRAPFSSIGSVFGTRSLDSTGEPIAGSQWGSLGKVARFRNPGLNSEVTISNPHASGKEPKRIIEGLKGRAEIISSNPKEIKLRSLSAHTEIIVVMEF